jgi:hypothetical protein
VVAFFFAIICQGDATETNKFIQFHLNQSYVTSEDDRSISGRRRLASSSSPLFQGMGTHYSFLWVGTPPQRVSVIMDTGSHHTAFPCTGCKCGKHVSSQRTQSSLIVGAYLSFTYICRWIHTLIHRNLIHQKLSSVVGGDRSAFSGNLTVKVAVGMLSKLKTGSTLEVMKLIFFREP